MYSYLMDLRRKICDLLNECPIDIDAKFFVLKDIYLEVERVLNDYLKAEAQQQESSEEEEIEEGEPPITEEVQINLREKIVEHMSEEDWQEVKSDIDNRYAQKNEEEKTSSSSDN